MSICIYLADSCRPATWRLPCILEGQAHVTGRPQVGSTNLLQIRLYPLRFRKILRTSMRISALYETCDTTTSACCLCSTVVIENRLIRALRKLRKVTVSYVTTVCPCDRTEQLGCHWTYFRKIQYLSIFRNICPENSSFINIGQKKLVI